MQKEFLKFEESTVFEGMTSIRSIIKSYDSGVNDRKILKLLFDPSKIKKNFKDITYLKSISDSYGFVVEECSGEQMEKMTLGNSHGGIIALAGNRSLPRLSLSDITESGFYVMIQGVEDPYNFGYALRSLYACGCSGIVLPERNWMSAAGVVSRSSAGASELFPVFTATPEDAVLLFKEKNYSVVCADERTDNVLGKCDLKFPIFLIIGGERRGISRSLLDMVDKRIKINYMRNFNASLSTASAATVFAYEIMRQNTKD